MSDLGDFSDYQPDDGDDTAGEGTGDDPATADETGPSEAGTSGTGPSGETTNTDAAADDGFESVAVETVGEDRGIGVVPVAEGLAIAADERDTSLRAYVTEPNRSGIRIGSYLLVPYPDGERLFCRIAGLEYAPMYRGDDATEIHARRAMRTDGIDEQDYKFVADLEPVAVIYQDGEAGTASGQSSGGQPRDGGELRRRMPDRVPKPETVVRAATETEEIKTGLKIPDDGVFLGHLAVGGERVRTSAEPPTIDYRLKDDYEAGDPLVFRHTLVAGGTGSGKTHAAKNVLRQYLADDRTYEMEDGREPNPAVVVFDPQDEYAQMVDDNPEATREEERDWERQGVAHGGHDDTVAFVPRVGNASYAASHHSAEQVEFTVPFSMVRGNPWLVSGAGLNDNQYGALTYLIQRFFENYGNEGTYEEFQAFLDDPALREELDETGRVHEETYKAVQRRVRSVPGGVFDQDARPITDLVHEFVRPGRLTVVPTYHVTSSRAVETVVLAVSSLLVDEKLSNDPRFDRIKETPVVLGMDEAHNFLTDAESVQATRVIGKFTEAAKQGRKERLGLFLVTQDPQDVADAVFKQVNTKVVLNLGDENAIQSVNIPSNLEEKVPYMEQGQMVVYSPDNSDPVEVVGLPTCLTRHGRE